MSKALFGTAIIAVAVISMGMTAPAFAQYMGNVDSESGATGKNTLEEALKLQKERVTSAAENPLQVLALHT